MCSTLLEDSCLNIGSVAALISTSVFLFGFGCIAQILSNPRSVLLLNMTADPNFIPPFSMLGAAIFETSFPLSDVIGINPDARIDLYHLGHMTCNHTTCKGLFCPTFIKKS